MSAMVRNPWSFACGASFFSVFRVNGRIRFFHHLFAEIHADQVVLKNVVVEHVLGRLTEIHDPLPQCRWSHAEGHILRVGGTRRMVVATDTADPAGDEVRVPRVFALHENAVAAEDRRSAVAFRHLPVIKIDLW